MTRGRIGGGTSLWAHTCAYWRQLASGLLLGLVGLALALAQPFWAGELIDRVQHARPIGLALVVVVGLTVAGAVCSGLQQLLLGALVERSTARWRRWFVDGFLRLPLLGRTRRGGGWFTARLVSDPPILGGFVGVGLVQSAQSAVLLIATLVILLAMDPISIAVPLGFALASLAIALLLARPAGRRRSALQRLNGTMATQMGTMVSGARLLIASNADDRQRSRIERDIGAAATEGTALNRLHSVAGPVTVVLMQVAYASVFVVGGWRVAERQMSFPELITFLMVFGLFQSSIHDVSTFPGSLSECRAALRHCAEVREVDSPHPPPPAGEARSAGLSHESGAHAAVRFSDVRFAYTHDGAAALEGASFRAPAGARTVIVGVSGCGKSTALGLIEGFYFASHGSVRVFGHEVTASSARALRERMGFVDQECTVIDASVRVNLGLGLLRPPSDEEMVRALQRTGLWPCLRERSGLDTMLGIDGLEMSGGQRQRIAIARAVVRDPEILILDEPTSALDGIAESRVLDVLEDLPGGTTVIMSAHRLSTILRADWVVALDGGRVVGEGSHRDLMQGCAFYRDLVSHQAVGPRIGSPV